MLKNLQYWNVDNQEAYYSAVEANEKLKNSKMIRPSICYVSISNWMGFS